MLSNAHTHTEFCDGRSSAQEMAEEAASRGFVSLGFSGHAPQAIDNHFGIKDEPGYMAEVSRLRAQYQGRMRIWLGAEFDLYGECDLSAYEYVIGAVHYLRCDGVYYGVDGDRDRLDYAFHTHYRGDGVAMARAYYDAVAECATKVKPHIFAHFDLIRKHNRDNRYFNPESAEYRRAALNALGTVKASGALLEVNTGGMARGYLTEPYPELFLLTAWREMSGDVILGSDCHRASDIAFAFDEAERLIRRAGFDSVLRLGTGQQRFERQQLA